MNRVLIFVIVILVGVALDFVVNNLIVVFIACLALGFVLDRIPLRATPKTNLPQSSQYVTTQKELSCPKCGSPIKEKQKFCKLCGFAIPVVQTQPMQPQNQFAYQPQYTSLQPQNVSARPTPQTGGSNVVQAKGKWCSQCGAPLNPRDRFCSTCGARSNV
jgi:predicted amidophosphoribosyltransferase